ncbi:hypothetical protein AMTR_s00135p00090760 [Amborella trichopoda]|uniref:Uncharacterized protein n=1 Tax=Amborella trichopoda TaxID=13333 RepID=W1NZ86_AMBTC|nr:hypothetical protein AMTR_s00135p00090760 [Amborella trichopoda]
MAEQFLGQQGSMRRAPVHRGGVREEATQCTGSVRPDASCVVNMGEKALIKSETHHGSTS